MFRSFLMIVTALSACLNSAHAAEESRSRREAYVAQMKLAQKLHAMNLPKSAKHADRMPSETLDRIAAVRSQQFGLYAGDAEKLAAVAMLGNAVQQAVTAKLGGGAVPKDFQIVESYPTRWRAIPAGDDLKACRNATEHDLSRPLHLTLARNGSVWLRITAPEAGTWAFDTFITEFDTRLSLYRDCREVLHTPTETSDDALGLGSIVGFKAKTAGETRVVRLDRIGGLGDLVIAKGGAAMTIAGRVTRHADNSPIPNIAVGALSSPTYLARDVRTNNDGTFLIYVQSAGEYQIRTGMRYEEHAAPELIDEAYPGVMCFGRSIESYQDCDGALVPIAIAPGEQVTQIDFALERGGAVIGRVLKEVTGAPLASVDVKLILQSATIWPAITRGARTDLNGRFRIDGVPPADWRVEFDHPQHVRERWNNVPCGTILSSALCETEAGEAIAVNELETVALEADLAAQDLLRMRATSIGGTINAAVAVYTANGNYFTGANTSYDGTIYIGPLPPGDYRFLVSSFGLYSRIYGGPACYLDCDAHLQEGQVVSIPRPLTELLIADLEPFPRLSGTVTRASTNAPLGGAAISIYDFQGQQDWVLASATGAFESERMLPGTYFLHTHAAEYVDELFPDIPCESDNPLFACFGAEPILVRPGEPPAPFAIVLDPSGQINGSVRTLSNGSGFPPIPGNGHTQLFRMSNGGDAIASSHYLSPSDDGSYSYREVPPGTHVFGMMAEGYRSQLFDHVDCASGSVINNPSCAYAAATALSWLGSESISAIDFDLSSSNSRLVRIRDADTLAPLAGVAVDQWSVSGTWQASSVTNQLGIAQIRLFSFTPDDPTTHAALVTTDNAIGYIDQVYEANECAVGTSAYNRSCSIAGATIVPIYEPTDAPFPQLEILLRPADPVFESGFE